MAPFPSVPSLRSKRLSRLGWGVCAAALAVAISRAMSASHPVPPRRLTEAERATVGRLCAAEEPRWRLSTMHRFPGDRWSQDDDFHASERGWALELSHREGVSPSEVFRAIDEELHTQPVEPPRRAHASPSKPRPFYD
jgi:hypothetical protein